MRHNLAPLVLVLLGACAGSKNATSSTPPSPQAAPRADTPPVAEKTARPAPVSPQAKAAPDVPSGAAAARDAELEKLATAVLETFTNSAPALTRDGKGVVFVSNRDGLPQLYAADAAKPEAPATRLVTSDERVSDAFPLADGKTLLFRSDHGADENWSFFRVGLDGTGLVELTPGTEMQRDEGLVVDGKPNTIFYSARRISAAQSTIYSTSAVTPSEEKPLYEHARAGFLNGVSKDGKWALFTDYLTGSENYGLLVDLSAGTAKTIFPTSGKAKIWGMAFAADDQRVFIATDGGAEQALVVAIDLASGTELARYVESKPATASVNNLVVAKSGDRIALGLDAGNRSDVRLLDNALERSEASGRGAGREV